MAFVSETERNINQISKTMCPLGPGQYFKDEQVKNRKDAAPFRSTSKRRSFLDVGEKQMPGVGNYEISKPFIEPNIKTVSNSQSIIVKINSTGTAQFKSVVDRFDVRDHQVPGPGKYSYNVSQSPRKRSVSHNSVKESKTMEKLKELTSKKKNFPAIPEKVRGLTDTKKEEVSDKEKLGPAFYNPNKKFYLNSTSTCWGKDKSRRFSLDSRSEVGPGKYNAEYNPLKPEDKVIQPSSNFKSSLVRTYWDSIFYKTNVSETAKIRDQAKFKPKEPAPGQYQVNMSSMKIQEKPFSYQFFGSTVERFPEKEIPEKKSKSFYNIKSDIGQNHSFNKSDHAFMADSKRNPEFLKVNEKEKHPGPGHYRENVKIEKKLKGNKLQKFGTNSKRMFQVEDKPNEVGPGKYEKNPLSNEEIMRNTRFGQIKDSDCTFKSTTNRDCFGSDRMDNFPFAEYDVTQNDLSKKVQKQKNFLDNLKKIDVEKAPFESSNSRFPHYEKKKEAPRNPVEETKEQELKIKQEADKVRDMILEANKAQVKETEKNCFGKTQRFMDQKKNAPPVGVYSLKLSWEKKSHNIKYQRK